MIACESSSTQTSISVNFAVVVFNKLFNKSAVLVQDLVSHVRDVVQNSLIFNLQSI